VALAALIKLRENNTIKATDRTVVISTAHGLKFSEFKVGYHEQSIAGISPKLSNMPISMAADAGKVREVLEREFAKRAEGK
jgi:threonine synthase